MSRKSRLEKLETTLTDRALRVLVAHRLCEEVDVMLSSMKPGLSAPTYTEVERYTLSHLDERLRVLLGSHHEA